MSIIHKSNNNTQQASVLQSISQSQPKIYSALCVPPQKHVTALKPPLKPQQLLPLNLLM